MKDKNICIIEDERDIAESLKIYLAANGYNVSTFFSAEEFEQGSPSCFVGVYLVDWNLPGITGLELIRKIRKSDKISPIFIISANSKRDEIVEGLRAGADDYIVKPFSFPELAARVNNATAKYKLIIERPDSEDFKLIPEASAFTKDGKTINLTPREFNLFQFLYDRAGELVSREEMVKEFFNDEKMTHRNVDVHIYSMRKKLEGVNVKIETVWGRGYKLV